VHTTYLTRAHEILTRAHEIKKNISMSPKGLRRKEEKIALYYAFDNVKNTH